ncbi:molybdenum cofactor biosynthesis protein MoaE [Paracoccus aestuariivivens]|uniref:Molybdopterin synthase catalytic subunit n=1 Tax=Paracoccus aestuariivivens TaxID=1820333 RepID=A0A6L6J513_9RHOB|nr:molybdenum cofactor biosynthesis protein MoaE [Paracoccus aestuariivivens]MTH76646.1 molybdenum cofactor biosynthesis protein MoaE [Paracoccus aestuariivivens]
MSARVQTEPFDLGAEIANFGAGAGAVVTFSGLVRDEGGRLVALEIEHYPGMTEKALDTYGRMAAERFGLSDWLIIHRHGRLDVGAPIMMVATASRHRAAAFQGAEFLMDWLKSRAPFWKREITLDGPGEWVDAVETDEDALSRW